MRHRTPSPRQLLIVSLTWLAALSACDRAGSSEVVCPSIYIAPHATLDLSQPMSKEATYSFEVEADGQQETCTLTIAGISGSKTEGDVVRGPMTQADMTCKLIRSTHVTDEGYIADFRTVGTPKHLKLVIKRGDEVLHQSDNTITYAPAELHGPGCPKTPHARVTIALSKL